MARFKILGDINILLTAGRLDHGRLRYLAFKPYLGIGVTARTCYLDVPSAYGGCN